MIVCHSVSLGKLFHSSAEMLIHLRDEIAVDPYFLNECSIFGTVTSTLHPPWREEGHNRDFFVPFPLLEWRKLTVDWQEGKLPAHARGRMFLGI